MQLYQTRLKSLNIFAGLNLEHEGTKRWPLDDAKFGACCNKADRNNLSLTATSTRAKAAKGLETQLKSFK